MFDPGLFGKLPETGDFVSLGLSQSRRRSLDRWVTEHLAGRRDGWPNGGLRGLLEIDGSLVLMVAVGSSDAVGRRFPLVAVIEGQGLSLETAELWCDGAARLLEDAANGAESAGNTYQKLSGIDPDMRDGPEGSPALWIAGQAPMACDAGAIAVLFSSG